MLLLQEVRSHIEANCWEKAKEQVNFYEEKTEEGNLFLAYMNLKERKSNIWFLDSGCSNNMTRRKSLFHSIDESVKSHIRLGDDNQVQIEGKGNIVVTTKSGIERLIQDVYFIPGLAHYLLSVGQLIQKGILSFLS